jgi:4-hydroxy-tetrahydrodipicolinate synthase
VPALRLTRAALSGDREATTAADAAFEPLWTLFRKHGSLRVMYLIADQLGLRSGQPPLPIQPLDGSVSKAVADAMEPLVG